MSILDEILDALLGGSKTVASAAPEIEAAGVSIWDILKAAPLGMTPPRYSDLPPSPVPEPPAIMSLDALDASFRSRVEKARPEIDAALAPLGFDTVVRDTYRDPKRQLWLWGIGRFYQAPGRTGIVTKVKDATGYHPRKKAVDFGYRDKKTGKVPQQIPSTVVAALKRVAPAIEQKYLIQWGGEWKTPDNPHWEDMA